MHACPIHGNSIHCACTAYIFILYMHILCRILKDFMAMERGISNSNADLPDPGQSSRQLACLGIQARIAGWHHLQNSQKSPRVDVSMPSQILKIRNCSVKHTRQPTEDGTQGMKAVDHRHQVLPELGSSRVNDQRIEHCHCLQGLVPVWVTNCTLMSSNTPNCVLKETEEPVGLLFHTVSFHLISIPLHAPRGFQDLSSSSCAWGLCSSYKSSVEKSAYS